MLEYLLRLALLIPLVGGLAWGSLWLWRRVQLGMPLSPQKHRAASIVDVLPMGTGGKLAVVHFGGRHLLVAVSRSAITLLADDGIQSVDEGDFHAG